MGAGIRGKRVFYHVRNFVEAFIDTDVEKMGSIYCGVPIISYEQFKGKKRECYIIVACTDEETITKKLKEDKITRFFLLSECPGELQSPNTKDILKTYVFNYLKNNVKYLIYGFNLYAIILQEWIKEAIGQEVPIIANDVVYIEGETLVPIEKIKKELQQYDEVLGACFDFENIKTKFQKEKIKDLERLSKSGDKCFSVNRIINFFNATLWRPDFYVLTDYKFIDEIGN